jgi:signal transduction histidine kinase
MHSTEHIVGRRLAVLRIGGMVTWLAVGTPVVVAGIDDRTVLVSASGSRWLIAYVVFGATLWLVSAPQRPSQSRAAGVLLLALLSASALVANYFISMPFPGVAVTAALLVISASVAGVVLGVFLGLAWVTIQSACLLATYLVQWPWQPAALATGAYTGFELFALFAASVAVSEARARESLAQAHERLVASQAALAENSRLLERSRIMRDLHDVLGHHLSVLSLTLEAAGRAPGEQAKELIRRASAIVRLSLSDVREVILQAESSTPMDLRIELERLAAAVQRPLVRLEFDQATPPLRGPQGVALARCAQESITNAIKHAKATSLCLRVRPAEGGVILEAADDGQGSEEPAGLGLTAMRARIESAGGRLEVQTAPGTGFAIRAWVPLGGEES